MAVNLVGAVGREPARALLESSFAQFQADRSVVGLARQVSRNLEALDGYAASSTCHLGDTQAYARLRARLKQRETELAQQGSAQRRAAAAASLEQLTVGDVVRVPGGRRSGLAVVLEPGLGMRGEAHPLVVTEDRWSGRLSLADFPGPVDVVGRLRLAKNVNARSPQTRRDLASSIRNLDVPPEDRRGRKRSAAADDDELARLRAALRAHAVHGCDEREQHMRWAERWTRLRSDTDALERRVAGKTSSVARTFERVCAVLDGLGYLDGDQVTEAGRQLARVYSEADLLVVQSLREGLWDALSPAELAAVVSALVYESRRPDESVPRVPSGAVQTALTEMGSLRVRLGEAERAAHVDFLRTPDLGFTWTAWRWAGGARLEQVLDDDPDLTAGDFVRWCKQVVDLLDQISVVAGLVEAASPVRKAARAAIAGVRRGVVAYSSIG
jgi:ATP-dependent RNA helicase HelY